MKKLEDYQNSNWIERITKYEDLRGLEEYWKLECERRDDNIIKRLIDLDTKVNVILKYVVNEEIKYKPRKNRKWSNSHENVKDDKSIEKEEKVEKKTKKRGRPRKAEKGE